MLELELRKRLTIKLANVIDECLSDDIELGLSPTQAYPYFGNSTGFHMAMAAIAVFDGIYDAELELVKEGWLDADGAVLPRGES